MKSSLVKFVPKKVSEKEKEEMVNGFLNGKTILELSEILNCSKTTISRHLKKHIGENKFKDLNKVNGQKIQLEINKEAISDNFSQENGIQEKSSFENTSLNETFMEIAPLNYEIDNASQKDLSSVPICDVDLPNIVYMIVDEKIELEIKYLKEYVDWQFLSEEELKRKTIEIYLDLKIAKRNCKKQQKVIKVPNTDVFKIVAPILIKRGISRIVSQDN